MAAENLLSEWSRLLLESLADAGLRDLVISPGSRSTPLVWAALGCRRLRVQSIVDERVAAFHALGRAKLTGRPAAVLCTSGSAAANYFPAVVEASLSHTPLLVITADRPFELMDCGASQTIDQTRLFGDHVRRFVELGLADGLPEALWALRRRAAQSLHDAIFPVPGPVHMNFRARKPLEPPAPGAASPAAAELTRTVDAMLMRPVMRIAPGKTLPPDDALEQIVASCLGAARGLVVAGPAPAASAAAGDALSRVVRALGFPLYAEATSQHRFAGPLAVTAGPVVDALGTLLGSASFRRGGGPDVVLQIGAAPVSGAWERLLAATPGMTRHIVAAHGLPDPHGTAATVVVADVEASLERLAELLERRPAGARSSPWSEHLARSNAAAWSAIDAAVAAGPGLSEGAAVRAVLAHLPRCAVLVVGNSLPVRHVDTFCRAGSAAELTVISQRGAAGIDGVISSAAGTAAAAAGPTVLLVGDVSALHDIGGLAAARAVATPFVVAVLNNDGGRIFEQLPLSQAGLPDEAWPLWTTPHGASFEAAAGVFGLPFARVNTEAALVAELAAGLGRQGATLLEVEVPPHGARAMSEAVARAVDEALAGLPPLDP